MLTLNEIIFELQSVNDEIEVYFDLDSKSFILYGDIVDESVYDFNVEEAFEEEPDRFIALPSKYEINEYDFMERFALQYPDKQIASALEYAIRTKGAFRRFKDTLNRYDLWDEYNNFELRQYKTIAIKWCRDNDLEYKDD